MTTWLQLLFPLNVLALHGCLTVFIALQPSTSGSWCLIQIDIRLSCGHFVALLDLLFLALIQPHRMIIKVDGCLRHRSCRSIGLVSCHACAFRCWWNQPFMRLATSFWSWDLMASIMPRWTVPHRLASCRRFTALLLRLQVRSTAGFFPTIQRRQAHGYLLDRGGVRRRLPLFHHIYSTLKHYLFIICRSMLVELFLIRLNINDLILVEGWGVRRCTHHPAIAIFVVESCLFGFVLDALPHILLVICSIKGGWGEGGVPTRTGCTTRPAANRFSRPRPSSRGNGSSVLFEGSNVFNLIVHFLHPFSCLQCLFEWIRRQCGCQRW